MSEQAMELSLLRKMNKITEESHGGYAGKSLVEKIRDDLDLAYQDFMEVPEDHEHSQEWALAQGLAEGIAHALGVLRSTSADSEWEEAENRWKAKDVSDRH